MKNYDNTNNKIEKLSNDLEKLNLAYSLLKKQSPKIKTVNYIKNKLEYTIGNVSGYVSSWGFQSDEVVYIVRLNNFPVRIIPFIKILPIISADTPANSIFLAQAPWRNEISTSFKAEIVNGVELYTLKTSITLGFIVLEMNCPQFLFDGDINLYINIPGGYDESKEE